MKNVIEVVNLTKKYDNFKLDGINLSIPTGSIVGLVGQNGAGKTTLIKLIFELIKKDSGAVKLFNGKSLKDAKEDVGVVLDDAFFPEILKVNDINPIMKGTYRNWDENLFKKYLNDFGLTHNQSIKELSKGMKKKLEIAVCLSHHPKLLILDEPTSGLDPVVRKEILDIFLNFVEDEQNTILLSSHITSDIESIADYIVFINEGKIIFNKSITDVNENYGIIKCGEKDFLKLDKTDVVCYLKNKYDYKVLTSDKKGAKRRYKDLVIDHASIEEIMLLFVKGDK
ncbi:MAG: ABC transporter ATP-binding protein [Bacilli bacterium]|nr:ABC transporter ATP-binding protein [Bacilli bacterium]